MINNKIITVTMPAYNAEQTLEKTFLEIPFDVVDNVIITDDCSRDNTVKVANKLAEKSQANVFVICHNKNKGYGGNQKSSYKKALEIDPKYGLARGALISLTQRLPKLLAPGIEVAA